MRFRTCRLSTQATELLMKNHTVDKPEVFAKYKISEKELLRETVVLGVIIGQ
ncbi:hypothetical protein ACFQIC_09450 [Halobacillus seohaensis]|uniref:Uncharacterized protein n=1 Tax=Halobacillus seohaensis TaxID=447421 RepID=A0ABW2EID2_9BACI